LVSAGGFRVTDALLGELEGIDHAESTHSFEHALVVVIGVIEERCATEVDRNLSGILRLAELDDVGEPALVLYGGAASLADEFVLGHGRKLMGREIGINRIVGLKEDALNGLML
jgi:hypothetical protein